MLLFIFVGSEARASRCCGPVPRGTFEEATSVVIVKVVSSALRVKDNGSEFVESNAIVQQIFKGLPGREIMLTSGVNGECSADVVVGKFYLAYVNEQNTAHVSECSRSEQISYKFAGVDEDDQSLQYFDSETLVIILRQLKMHVTESAEWSKDTLPKPLITAVLDRAINRISKNKRPSIEQLRYVIQHHRTLAIESARNGWRKEYRALWERFLVDISY